MPAPTRPFLPYGRQSIDDDDIEAVADVLRSDFLTTGPVTGRFEAALADICGARWAVACANGTAALHLAMMALGIGPGDVVVVPSVTFLATANAARFVGADVVFADVNRQTGLMTPDTLEAALDGQSDVKAIVPVHLGGQMCDMAALARVAGEIPLIEDAAHALGSRRGGDVAGGCRYSVMTCFSFHPVKTVAMGEGGAVTTNDPELRRRLKTLHSHGMVGVEDEQRPWAYEMFEIGYNYRVSDIQCALGLSQLNKLDRFAARRRDLVARYDQAFSGVSEHMTPVYRDADQQTTWHLYQVLIDFAALGATRGDVMARLRAQGIGSQVHYIPVHTQPYYRAIYGDLDLPGAAAFYDRTLSLPLYPSLSDADQDRVIEAVVAVIGGGQ